MTTTTATVDVYGPNMRTKGYVSNPTVEVTTTHPTLQESQMAGPQSLWVLSTLFNADVGLAITPLPLCRHEVSNLRHFNQRSVLIVDHCDFHSVELPELNSALEALRQAQLVWEEAVAHQAHSHFGKLADVTYADVDYPPRPRKYDAAVVRVDPPNATRVRRGYTDEDTEVWGP